MSGGYINTQYDVQLRPLTDYPVKLCVYLANRFGFMHGQRLLEVGCGRCEFLNGFGEIGLDTYGADACEDALAYAANQNVKIVKIGEQALPFPDNHFDIVFSKSFVEHLQNPMPYFEEAKRVLKPGGMLVTMVPDWESCHKIYFDDVTHKTPFTTVTLSDCYRMIGLCNSQVEKFRQLPVAWRFPVLNLFCGIIAPFIPVRAQNKFLRWSRELMILGIAHKR